MLCSIFERSTRLIASLKSLSLFYSKRLFSPPEGECRPEEGRATKWPGRRGVRGAIAGCCLVFIPLSVMSAEIVTTKITATSTAFKNMSTQTGKFHGFGSGTFIGGLFGNFSGNSSGTFTGRVNGTYVVTTFGNLSAAKVAIGTSKATLEVPINQSVNTLTLPSTLTIKPTNGAIITIASGKTLTINGTLLDPGVQCFAGAGSIAGLKEARPGLFGTNTTPGTTDMTEAINKALVAANGGKLIFKSNVTYGIGSAITLPSNGITIEGNGAVLKHLGSTLHSMITSSGVNNITIRDLKLDGDMANVTTYNANRWSREKSIYIQTADDVLLENIEMYNQRGQSIQFLTGNRITVKNCWIHDTDNLGIFIGNCNKVLVTGNRVYNGYTHGIAVFAESGTVNDVQITYNNVEAMKADVDKLGSGLGITVWSAAASGMSGVVVANNICTNNESMNFSLTSFVNITASGDMSVTGNYAYGAIVSTYTGPVLSGGINYELRGRGISFTGNTSVNPELTHIVITDADTINVSANTLYKDTRSVTLTYGIDIFASLTTTTNTDITIANNTIKHATGMTGVAGMGIRFSGLLPTVNNKNVKITNNEITGDFSSGIYLGREVDNLTVSDNTIDLSTSTAAADIGVNVRGDNTKISNNTITPVASQPAIVINTTASPAANVVITDNITNTSGATAYGISIVGTVTTLTVARNDARGATKHTADFYGAFNTTTVRDLGGNSWNYDTAAPAGGYHKVGSRVINFPPIAGQPKAWSCTVQGTPGTWVSEGNL